MTRRDLQDLARIRIREASLLLRDQEPSGAYYLTGLSVECALKACIARNTRRFDFPSRNWVNASYSHDLLKLMTAAKLLAALEAEVETNPALEGNWSLVKDWKIDCRYDIIDAATAQRFYAAVTARSNGVLGWVKCHW